MMKSNVIWIDKNIDSKENNQYISELDHISFLKIRKFNNIEKSIYYLNFINFEEVKVIVSGELYNEFVKLFKENVIYINVAPKIVIFTQNKKQFIDTNPDYIKDTNIFYNFCGVHDYFKEIKQFIKNEIKIGVSNEINEHQSTFECIDSKEKLEHIPLFFKTLIDNVSNENMKKYTSELYKEYGDNDKVKNILSLIKSIPNIPIEILSKYYARLYTINSNFYKNMNKDLRANKIEKYLPFIKTLYEGVKLKSLPLAHNNILYRGAIISNDEIKNLKDYMNKKIHGLPSSIIFSKLFLSFTKEESIVYHFLNQQNEDKKLSKVLFILEKDDNLEYNLSTHGDIEKILNYPSDREVFFII